ncbi:MAG: hypothetical protein M3040_13550 [Bacteroidota bacterium]|nr:hypothetical protein [Bacteroidota bacterium]
MYKEAVYVGKRFVNGRIVVLYQLHSFYIEVFYSKYRLIIDHINCSTSTSELEPYLKQINIEELISV